MKKLTSKATFWHKRVFPIIWYGLLIFFFAISYFPGGEKHSGPIFLFPLFMGIFSYFLMKKLFFDLVDEAYDEGDTLLFKNSGRELRVNLRDIKNVNYQVMMNPPKVTLMLRHKTEFGDEISFSPPSRIMPFSKNKDIEKLIDRIDQARSG